MKVNSIYERVGSCLKGTRLYNPAKRVYYAVMGNRIPHKKSIEMLSYDELDLRIRLKLHSIEKNLCIGNLTVTQNATLIDSLLADLEAIIRKGAQSSSDIVQDTVAMIALWSRYGPASRDRIEKKTESLLKKYHCEAAKGMRTISIVSTDTIEIPDEEFYPSFARTRHSQRYLSANRIPENRLKEAIEIALLCPSACNRQPCRIYYAKDDKKRGALRDLCVDKLTAKGITNFLVVTVRSQMFLRSEEGQALINGGIFVDSLVNAFHSKGIGSCIFQTVPSHPKYGKIRRVMEIPKDEQILCMMGFGEYEGSSRMITKHRRNVEDILVSV